MSLTFEGKPLKDDTLEKATESYVNIRTNRKISTIGRKDFTYIDLYDYTQNGNYIFDHSVKICGTHDDIAMFLDENQLDYESSDEQPEKMESPKKTSVQTSVKTSSHPSVQAAVQPNVQAGVQPSSKTTSPNRILVRSAPGFRNVEKESGVSENEASENKGKETHGFFEGVTDAGKNVVGGLRKLIASANPAQRKQSPLRKTNVDDLSNKVEAMKIQDTTVKSPVRKIPVRNPVPTSNLAPVSQETQPKRDVTTTRIVPTRKAPAPKDTCRMDTAGTALLTYKDVHELTHDEIQKMCYFNLAHVESKYKVLNVKDGDTVDGAMEITLDTLREYRDYGSRPVQRQVTVIAKDAPDTKFIARIDIRVFGVDTAEHDTIQGQLAKYLFTELVERYNNNIYVKIVPGTHGKNKVVNTGHKIASGDYGRYLGEFYLDKDFRINISKLMVGKTYGSYGVIAEDYYGPSSEGNKSEYMKTLKTITKAEANRIDDIGFIQFLEENPKYEMVKEEWLLHA